MEDPTFSERINSLVASQSILQHLAMALFDAIDDKTRVIQQFNATTNETLRLSSGQPKAFLSTFEQHRQAILKLLVETKAEIGPPTGAC